MQRIGYRQAIFWACAMGWSQRALALEPVQQEQIVPVDRATFQGACSMNEGGVPDTNPRMVGGDLLFDSVIGDRQSDPQIAVGGDHVLVATNSGNFIYDRAGMQKAGTNLECFSGSPFPIDPKMYFDPVSKRYGMGRMDIVKDPWSARIAISKGGDPSGGWWQYNIDVTDGVDGGAIGFSGNWIVYLYPAQGGGRRVLALDAAQVREGKPANLFRFESGDFDFGQPTFTHDEGMADQYFIGTAGDRFTVSKIHGPREAPVFDLVEQTPHDGYFGFPPGAPQKGSDARLGSGDPTAKIAIVRKQSIWFANDYESTLGGREHAAIHWGQLSLTGQVEQLGGIDDPSGDIFFMQPTLGVNVNGDVLVGYQTSSASSFVSAHYAYRLAGDPPGELRPPVALQEGSDAADDGAWGDYSGTSVDGDNLLDIWTLQSFASAKSGRIHHTIVARHAFEGMGGTGGVATGGAAGASGAAGTAGAASGGSSNAGSGGAVGGSSAAGTGGVAAASGAGNRPSGDPSASSGCGCRFPGQSRRSHGPLLILLLGAAYRRRRLAPRARS